MRKTYKGAITELPENGVFCFGANPVGINGNPVKGTGGAALVALNNGWVEQGEKMDNRLSNSGKAWGITTVAWPGKKRSKTSSEIQLGIFVLYEHAKRRKDKEFYIAYSAGDRNLNGYTDVEMARMFAFGNIPSNIIFEEGFNKLIESL